MTEKASLAIIVAAAKNGVIGVNNTLPWHLSADLQHFKRMTIGKPVVMGRKTFDSIGRPLPNRTNIVVTHQPDWHFEGVTKASSLDEALAVGQAAAESSGVDEVILMGGGTLYAQGIGRAETVYLTEVDCEVAGDAVFPRLSSEDWCEVSREHHTSDAKNDYNFAFVTMRRRTKL